MNLPPLRNPYTRFRTWVRDNRAQAEIAVIAALAIGMILLMFVVTLVIVFKTLR